MAWRYQASHYLSQSRSRPMSPYRVTRPQWVKSVSSNDSLFVITFNYTYRTLLFQERIWMKFDSKYTDSRHENEVRSDGHFLSKTICPHLSCRLVLYVIFFISPWCHYYQVFTDILRHNMCRNDRFLCEACKITSNCLRNRQNLYTCMAYPQVCRIAFDTLCMWNLAPLLCIVS